jgi:hypothetical protein
MDCMHPVPFHHSSSMKLSTTHLKRYKEIAGLFQPHGRSDIVKQMGMDPDENKAEEEERPAEKKNGGITPAQLVDDLQAMGPTYVKLGQVLAGRPDVGRHEVHATAGQAAVGVALDAGVRLVDRDAADAVARRRDLEPVHAGPGQREQPHVPVTQLRVPHVRGEA